MQRTVALRISSGLADNVRRISSAPGMMSEPYDLEQFQGKLAVAGWASSNWPGGWPFSNRLDEALAMTSTRAGSFPLAGVE